MILKRTLVAALIATTFSGCANMQPRGLPDASIKNSGDAKTTMEADWTEPAVLRDGRPSIVLVTPMAPPKEMKDKPVSLAFESGTTVKDVVAVLANLGYSIILGDEKVGDKEFYLPRYKGTLGGLMSAISRTADVWFSWHDGVVVVTSKERIMLSVPQDEGLSDKMQKGLVSMGLTTEDTTVSFPAGMMSAEVKPSQLNKVKSFLERITSNAALVTMQVAVVTVSLNQTTQQGVDWTKLQGAIGNNHESILSNLNQNGASGAPTGVSTPVSIIPSATGTTTPAAPSTTPATTTPATATTTTGSTATGSTTAASTIGNSLLLGGTGLRAVATNGLFSLVGFIDFLNTYGLTETKQNVVLKTITGNEVKLKSVTQIPYVSGVSVTSASGAAGGANGALLGGTTTATANDGLTLNMTPSFDSYSNTVTVKMDLSIQAVIGFNNLSAGSQLGSLSQPTTAERSFNDIIRVRPGQTVVVGGITYDSIGDSRNAPSFLEGTTGEHKALTVNKLTMFIVVRPTITVLGAMAEKEGNEIFPDAADAPVATATVRASAKLKKTAGKD